MTIRVSSLVASVLAAFTAIAAAQWWPKTYAVARPAGGVYFEVDGVSTRGIVAASFFTAACAGLLLFLVWRSTRRNTVETCDLNGAAVSRYAVALGVVVIVELVALGFGTIVVLTALFKRGWYEPWHLPALAVLALAGAALVRVLLVVRRGRRALASLTDVADIRWRSKIWMAANLRKGALNRAVVSKREALAVLEKTGAAEAIVKDAAAQLAEAERALAADATDPAGALTQLGAEIKETRRNRAILVRSEASAEALASVDAKLVGLRAVLRTALRAAGAGIPEAEPATLTIPRLLVVGAGRWSIILPAAAGAVAFIAVGVAWLQLAARGNDCALGGQEAFAYGGTRHAQAAPTEIYRFCTTPAGGVDDGLFQGWALRTGLKTVDGRIEGGKFTGKYIDPVRQTLDIRLAEGKVVSTFASDEQLCGPASARCRDSEFPDFIDVPALDSPDPIMGYVRSLDCPKGRWSHKIVTEPRFGVDVECSAPSVTFGLKLRPHGDEWEVLIESFEFRDHDGSRAGGWAAADVDRDLYGRKRFTARLDAVLAVLPSGSGNEYARGGMLYEAGVMP
ncbi:MAG: hypothetical protein HYS27_11780 [Deltaproteobacteria bacterium]|nr:hypothetical protein [Deltaproteobacteria bacterium]